MRFHLDGRTRAGILEGRVRCVLRAGNGQEITSGMVVPVMPASGPAVFRVRVIDADWLPVGDALPDGDVKRARDLGYRTSADARRAWLQSTDRRLRALAAEAVDGLEEADWADAWSRNDDRSVWLVRVAVEPQGEVPRFLARGGRADGVRLLDNAGFKKRVPDGGEVARGYTTVSNGAVDDAECVSDADLAKFQLDAANRAAALFADQRDVTLKMARKVLPERQVRVLQQQLETAERRFKQSRGLA